MMDLILVIAFVIPMVAIALFGPVTFMILLISGLVKKKKKKEV